MKKITEGKSYNEAHTADAGCRLSSREIAERANAMMQFLFRLEEPEKNEAIDLGAVWNRKRACLVELVEVTS